MLRNSKFIFYIVLFVGLSTSMSGQKNAKEVLEKFKEVRLKNKDYQVNVEYKMFRGYHSDVPYDIMKGVFYKRDDKSYTKLGEVEIVNTLSIHLKVNHKEKAILVADGLKTDQNSLNVNIDELLNYIDIDTLQQTNEVWKVFLKAKPITQLPFSSVVVDIDKKTYGLKKQIFLYNTKMNFSKTYNKVEVSDVKLEVNYTNYRTTNFSVSDSVFNVNNYVIEKNNEYRPSKKGIYKDYELIDIRGGYKH